MRLREVVRALAEVSQRHAPVLLGGIAIGGVVTTAVFAARGAIDATYDVLQDKSYRDGSGLARPTRGETFRLVWPHYVPAVGSAAITIFAIVAAQRVNSRRYAAVAAAFTLSEKALDNYRDRVVELLGERQDRKIIDRVSAKEIERNPINKEVIITGNGDMLCYEPLTSRYFESNRDAIDRAVNRLNEELLRNDYASLNDFYNWLQIPTSVLGDDLGWTSDNILEVSYSSHLSEDGRPCLAIFYQVQPHARYYRPSSR